MTREHKLALIVGFSLVLLVGVLISDHLSRARHAQVLAIGSDDPVPTEVSLRTPVDPLVAVGDTPPAQAQPSNQPPAAQPPANDASQIAAAPQSPQLPTNVPTDLDTAITQPPVQIAQGAPPAVVGTAATPGSEVRLVNALGNEGILVEPKLGGEPVVVKPPPVIADPIAPPKPAEDAIRWHTVKRGETLFKIATKYYGNGHRWKEIALANKGRVTTDGTAREGVRLKIPGLAAATPPTQIAAANKPAAPVAKPDAKPDSKVDSKPASKKAATYTVKPGDTIGVIAQRTLGTSRRAEELIKANDLDDEDHITVGMVLKIPGA